MMTHASDSADGAETPERAAPQVFVRVVTTPPGLPWEQLRAAQLEAQHGGPLPIAELLHRLRRIEGWALGRTGRFAVFYVRAKEYRAPFEATVDVEGQAVRVAFGAGAEQLRRARQVGLAAGLTAAVIGLCVGSGFLALTARSETAARLAKVEAEVEARSRAAKALEQRQELAAELAKVAAGSHSVSAVLQDLSWATAAKAADARILAVHWDQGLLALEVRGEAPPFAHPDRPVESMPEPVRPGVYLWGVAAEEARRPTRTIRPVAEAKNAE